MNIRKNRPCLIIIVCIWCVAVFCSPKLYQMQATPLYEVTSVNDSYLVPCVLNPGDTLTQSFLLTEAFLNNADIAFTYEDAATQISTLTVRFFADGTLYLEQPLPLAACPKDTFLYFLLNLENCLDKELTISITNTSENEAGVFSVMATPNKYCYQDYTEGYSLNNELNPGSILCNLNYRTGFQSYKGITAVFWLLIAATALSRAIWLGWAWIQRRGNR